MNNKTLLVIILICFISVISCLAMAVYLTKDHRNKMDLIEEKRALIELQNMIEVKETQFWLDSMIKANDILIKELDEQLKE